MIFDFTKKKKEKKPKINFENYVELLETNRQNREKNKDLFKSEKEELFQELINSEENHCSLKISKNVCLEFPKYFLADSKTENLEELKIFDFTSEPEFQNFLRDEEDNEQEDKEDRIISTELKETLLLILNGNETNLENKSQRKNHLIFRKFKSTKKVVHLFMLLWKFFEKLKMENHLRSLMYTVDNEFNQEETHFLFLKAVEYYEKDQMKKYREFLNKDLSGTIFFNSEITKSCYSKILNKYKSYSDISIMNVLESCGLLSVSIAYMNREVYKTRKEFLGGKKKKIQKKLVLKSKKEIFAAKTSLIDIFKNFTLELMNNNKVFWNLTLVSNDKKEEKGHLEFLIKKSNFFYQLYSFGGIETSGINEKRKLYLENLNFRQLKLLLSHIYERKMKKTKNFKDLIVIYQLSEMHFDYGLRKDCMDQLKSLFPEPTSILNQIDVLIEFPQLVIFEVLEFILKKLGRGSTTLVVNLIERIILEKNEKKELQKEIKNLKEHNQKAN